MFFKINKNLQYAQENACVGVLLLYSPWGECKICDASKRHNLEDRVTLNFNAVYCLLLTAWRSVSWNTYYSLLISFKVMRSSRLWRFDTSQILPSPQGEYNNYITKDDQDQVRIMSRSKNRFFLFFHFKIFSKSDPKPTALVAGFFISTFLCKQRIWLVNSM